LEVPSAGYEVGRYSLRLAGPACPSQSKLFYPTGSTRISDFWFFILSPIPRRRQPSNQPARDPGVITVEETWQAHFLDGPCPTARSTAPDVGRPPGPRKGRAAHRRQGTEPPATVERSTPRRLSAPQILSQHSSRPACRAPSAPPPTACWLLTHAVCRPPLLQVAATSRGLSVESWSGAAPDRPYVPAGCS